MSRRAKLDTIRQPRCSTLLVSQCFMELEKLFATTKYRKLFDFKDKTPPGGRNNHLHWDVWLDWRLLLSRVFRSLESQTHGRSQPTHQHKTSNPPSA